MNSKTINSISREQISELVINCIKDFQQELDSEINLEEGENTKLFGSGAQLDSMSLVSLIVNIEEAIEEELNISITLADEKAMSRRVSPFGRISYLVDYILELLNEEMTGNNG